MKIYYVTPEIPLDGEGELLSSMIEAGVERVHLRHPNRSFDEVRSIINSVPQDMRGRVMLHDYHRLALDYGCGIHLNRRNPVKLSNYHGKVSCSCHSLVEVSNSKVDYCFLSPFFDSISKSGYKAGEFDVSLLKELLYKKNIVALGGITPDKFESLRSLGFSSAALSGYLTGEGTSMEIIKRLHICFNS
ncbi:MAG: thiamine phosphate synthase [Muribaculaceae bacterium]|nr:thiamine phosphate synthase [Muribaculaceae bacterium]